jgi:hypothetical protein
MGSILLVLLVAVLLIFAMSATTTRKELFGYAGYKSHIKQVVIDDPLFNSEDYTETSDVSVGPYLMQELVFATNKYVSEKTNLCTYIIETTSIKKYVTTKEKNKRDLYRVMFMVMKQHGFAFGFAVTSDMLINEDGTVEVVSVRTQPMGVPPVTDQSPFTSDIEGHEFADHDLFKESELDLLKQKPVKSNDKRQ